MSQAKPTLDSQKNFRPWLVGGGIGIALLLMLWNGLQKNTDRPTITSQTQYNEVLLQAARLSMQHLKDVDDGIELTEPDKMDLRKAAGLFDSLSDFQTNNIAPFVGAGKVYQALGNDDAAIKRLSQGLATVSANPVPEVKDTAIEAHYLLSLSYFNEKDYRNSLTEANTAIKMFPASPIYLSQRASICIQLQRYGDAAADLATALNIDPQHKRTLQLVKLLSHSASEKSDNLLKDAIPKFNAKNYKGVVEDCTTGLAIDVANTRLLCLRAAAYIGLGDKKKAKTDADLVRKIDPEATDLKKLDMLLK